MTFVKKSLAGELKAGNERENVFKVLEDLFNGRKDLFMSREDMFKELEVLFKVRERFPGLTGYLTAEERSWLY